MTLCSLVRVRSTGEQAFAADSVGTEEVSKYREIDGSMHRDMLPPVRMLFLSRVVKNPALGNGV